MTIRLRLPDPTADAPAATPTVATPAAASDDLATFTCSPAAEALRSLHVLHNAKHHPLHISWILQARERMGAELRAEADRYAFWYTDRPLVFREIWPAGDAWSWNDELAALREAPVGAFAEQLIHGALARCGRGPRIPLADFRTDPGLRDQALAAVEARHRASLPAMRELIDDPAQCRARFAGFLERYWDRCLAADWPSLERHLLDDIARRARTASRHGLARMLEELSAHVHPDLGGGGVVVRPPAAAQDADPLQVELTAGDRILLVPSHFVWPELTAVVQRDLRGGRERQTVVIAYALDGMQQQGRAPVPPEDLLRLLRSAGDPTRLQILQLLARRPRSTREIAGLVGLTEAGISKHVKLLQEAGWVSPERRGYYVYYHLLRDSGGRLARGLEQLLG
jgi:DNA-binding transcriptional ArsR family regulator